MKDYYAILGVIPSAETAVIKAAYKALSLIYHPDRYKGSADEANRKMAEINEAFSVLSDSEKRRKYDEQRGSNTQNSDDAFADDVSPQDDPLHDDWQLAAEIYPDLIEISEMLSKVSWKLSNSYKATLLQTKDFKNRDKFAEKLETQFLKTYFGKNKIILDFARELIYKNHKDAARALNKYIRVLGDDLETYKIIYKIRKEFNVYENDHHSNNQTASNETDSYESSEHHAPNSFEKFNKALLGFIWLLFFVFLTIGLVGF